MKAGDALFFAADKPERAATLAGLARTRIGRELNLIPQDEYKFCWIVDFPMYEWNEEDKRIDFSHNPFSMPQYRAREIPRARQGDKDTILGLKAYQYDIVCNGYELSSGAIRNHDPDVMLKAFEIAGYAREETESKFAGMLNAFRHGAPPHGGTAPGIDRIVMLLAGEENLREVTMFPMTQQAQDLLMNAPSPATAKQLKELHLKHRLSREVERLLESGMSEGGPVPGRRMWRAVSACCVVFAISMIRSSRKAAGERLPQSLPTPAAAIYESRPDMCRTWHVRLAVDARGCRNIGGRISPAF